MLKNEYNLWEDGIGVTAADLYEAMKRCPKKKTTGRDGITTEQWNLAADTNSDVAAAMACAMNCRFANTEMPLRQIDDCEHNTKPTEGTQTTAEESKGRRGGATTTRTGGPTVRPPPGRDSAQSEQADSELQSTSTHTAAQPKLSREHAVSAQPNTPCTDARASMHSQPTIKVDSDVLDVALLPKTANPHTFKSLRHM